jgi:hypothetical protein
MLGETWMRSAKAWSMPLVVVPVATQFSANSWSSDSKFNLRNTEMLGALSVDAAMDMV